MNLLPALCKSCNKLFSIQSPSTGGGTFIDCVAVPCPYCGGEGKIPSGHYSFVHKLFDTIIEQKIPLQYIIDLKEKLEDIQRTKMDFESKLNSIIKSDDKGLLSELKTISKEDLKWAIGIVIVIIIAIIGFQKSTSSNRIKINNDNRTQIINNSYLSLNPSPKVNAINSVQSQKKSRNKKKSKRKMKAKSRKINRKKNK
jgi:hypothetical protein